MADQNRNGALIDPDAGEKQCSFKAGSVKQAPIRVSYFLVVMFIMQVIFQMQANPAYPFWWKLVYALGSEFILLLTIFIHEMGHGSMSSWLGGRIESILLWPFGGVCFSSRNPNITDPYQKIRNELKIVVSGPATHFLQAPVWFLFLYLTCLGFPDASGDGNITRNLGYAFVPPGLLNRVEYPIGPDRLQGFYTMNDKIPPATAATLGGALLKELMLFGVQINVLLFLFNAFFPMYPMDSAKIMVCSLQLFGVKSYTAAWVLIFATVPCAIALLVVSFMDRTGNVMSAVTGFMCVMCLFEAWKIYKLISHKALDKHYLFELAEVADNANGVTTAGDYGNFNGQFGGAGQTLGGGSNDNYNNAAVRSRSNANTLGGGNDKFHAFGGQGFVLGDGNATSSKVLVKKGSKTSQSGYGSLKQGP